MRYLLSIWTILSFTFMSQAEKPPNIVFVLADDLGYGDIGCYNAKSKLATPNVNRLAREGMRFTDAHSASAVCSPTRYGLLTGRYAWRTRLKSGVLGPYDPPLIEADRLTLPAMLKQNGYHTACVGKWHLGWNWPKKDDKHDFTKPIADGPTKRGFDFYFGTDVPNYPPYCFLLNDRTVGQPTDTKATRDLNGRPGPMLPNWKFDAILPRLAEVAVQHIKERAAEKKPFFLYFPLTSPHEPIAPSENFRGKSGINPVADFILETDWVVGQVLETLDKQGLTDNTLVIFAADNGHSTYTGLDPLLKAGHQPSGPLRGYKGMTWEGGHRVPFVARWPGKIKAGTTSDETICLNDVMATCAAILKVKLPNLAAEDSYNILPALLGEKYEKPLREATVHHSVNGTFAIRQGPWKLILGQGQGSGAKEAKPMKGEPPGQLYHLVDDLGETTNLYEKNPEIVKRMTALLETYKKDGRSHPMRVP